MPAGVYGWDIGGSQAVVAKVEDGGVTVVPNKMSGERSTPVVVGASENSGKGIRQIGVHSPNSVGDLRDIMGNGDLQGEKMLASFMTHLRDNVSNSPTNCYVLTVPHYFTDAEVSAVLDAFQVSGASEDGVVVDVMPDLAAAALAYGYYKASSESKKIVLVDYGHSAVQAALVEFTPEGLEILAYEHDRLTGGKVLNERISSSLMKEFLGKHTDSSEVSTRAERKLSRAAENAKKTMSANKNKIPVSVECFHEDRDLTKVMCRSEFEAMCQDSFDRVKECLGRLKSRAGDDIQSVEIIGGSSRIPKFKEVVGEVFEGLPVRTSLNADEAVARGAALHCAAVTNLYRVRPYRITDLQTHSVRVKYSGDKTHTVRPGSKLMLDCRPEGDTVVLEYEKPPLDQDQKSLIAVYQLDLPQNVMEEEEEVGDKIELDFRTKKGRLSLHSCALAGQEVKFNESRVGGMTRSQLSECQKEERRLMEQDKAEIQRQNVKNQLEEAVYTFRSVLSETSADHRKVVEEASAFVQDSQDKIDNDDEYPDWSVEQYQTLLRQVEERSKVYQQSLIELSEQMKAESRRQHVKKQFETAFNAFKNVLNDADCEEETTRHFKAASRFVANVQEAIDSDESYPDWPVEEYVSLLQKVQQLNEDFNQWLEQRKRMRHHQQDRNDYFRRSPGTHHHQYNNHRRAQNFHPLFGGGSGSMFDDDGFDRSGFFAQNSHRPRSFHQPTFYDMFW